MTDHDIWKLMLQCFAVSGLFWSSCYTSTGRNSLFTQAHVLNDVEDHSGGDTNDYLARNAGNVAASAQDDASDRATFTTTGQEQRNKAQHAPRLWPLPYHVTSGELGGGGDNTTFGIRYITLSLEQTQSFQFSVAWPRNAAGSIAVDGSQSTTGAAEVLSEAFQRYRALIFSRSTSSASTAGHREFGHAAAHPLISVLLVRVHSSLDTLRYGVDESYTLAVPNLANASEALIEANTIFGALRGLETFSQLCVFDVKTRKVQIQNAPWSVFDKPRFPYRGLLIDTARHYQPPKVIKQVIDAMSYAKFNVLHWHIVDTQSFPLEIPSYPKLWQGSFSTWERYTVDDAQDIVEYARRRGINVMAELDVPGHASSWGVGYPQLWPSPNCTQPLDVSRNFTFRLIDGILSDFAKLFPFDFVHMGGDEVNTSCWTQTPRIIKWLRKYNYTGFDAYKQFVLKAETLSVARGYIPVNWEEPFDLFGAELNPKTVIHNWLGRGVAPKVVKAGLRCIVSNQDAWYLDHLDVGWQTFYSNEPWDNITAPSERALVLGGEVCMWGETVDASDIQQTIWPRAAAAAERLWSSLKSIANAPQDVLPRLRHFRCLLNERGIAASPVSSVHGRDPPNGPGSCYSQ